VTAFLIASLLLVALAWGPAAAHLLELSAKLDLGREDYQTVQQIYRGWALLAIVVFPELIATAGTQPPQCSHSRRCCACCWPRCVCCREECSDCRDRHRFNDPAMLAFACRPIVELGHALA